MTTKHERMPWQRPVGHQPEWLRMVKVKPSKERPEKVQDADAKCEKDKANNRSGR